MTFLRLCLCIYTFEVQAHTSRHTYFSCLDCLCRTAIGNLFLTRRKKGCNGPTLTFKTFINSICRWEPNIYWIDDLATTPLRQNKPFLEYCLECLQMATVTITIMVHLLLTLLCEYQVVFTSLLHYY